MQENQSKVPDSIELHKECTHPCECFINHIGPNAMVDHVDGTMMTPGFIELAQVFLAFQPGADMDGLEIHDRDISGLHVGLGNHLGSNDDEDELENEICCQRGRCEDEIVKIKDETGPYLSPSLCSW